MRCIRWLALMALVASPLGAQGVARVVGTVTDSTRMRPVAGARVYAIPVATGGRLQALTDSAGRYSFDGLPLGMYLLDVRHARRDSLGVDVPLISLELRTPGDTRADLALPSIKTIVTQRCGADVEQEGGGIISGVVRRAGDESPASGAVVSARWHTFSVEGGRMQRDSGTASATADDAGGYLFCGLPPGAGIRVVAHADADSSGMLAITMTGERLVQRNLFVAPRRWRTAIVANGAGDTASVSVLSGTARLAGRVQDAQGNAVDAARVRVEGAGGQAVSSQSGSFLLDSLPEGTHTIDVRAIGFMPEILAVDLLAGSTAQTALTLTRVTAVLDTIRVTGQRVYTGSTLAGVQRRRRTGMGWHMDVEQIEKQHIIFPNDLLFMAPGVFLRGAGPDQYIAMRGLDGQMCSATILVDGVRIYGDGMALQSLVMMDRIVAVESYHRPAMIPAELPNPQNGCGLVAFWTGSRERPTPAKK